jgi:Xaa-Pro aminopeptidase
VAAALCGRGGGGAPGDRQRARRLPGGAGIPRERVERLLERLDGPFLVSAPVNVRYLTGFESSNAALLVDPAGDVRLFTDFRYAERARQLEGVEVEETPRYLYTELPKLLPPRVAFEADAVTYANYGFLRDGGLELEPRRGVVEGLRAVKEPEELEAIRRATEVTDATYERLFEEPVAGRTEKELVWRMEQLFHDCGADGLAFDVDIASGPTAASPHAVPGDRVVEEGEMLLVDAGARVDGYCSDCTRTYAVGDVSDELRELYEVVKRSQQAGVDAVRPGASGYDVDAAARDVIVTAGHGGNFGHGLGHGVGLLIHEAPVLRPESSDVLEPGNVVTVEPGIYLSGVAGIRIEDTVVVTDDGVEILTGLTKELTVVS